MGVSPQENFKKSLSVILFDIINNVSGITRGRLKSTPRNTLSKCFLGGRDFVQRGSTLQPPLEYNLGGRPMGMGDPGDGGPKPNRHRT